MNAKNILIKATAAVAIATVGFVGLSATAANASFFGGEYKGELYAKNADAPTQSHVLMHDSKGAKAKSAVIPNGKGEVINQAGGYDIFAKKNGTHQFRITWSGFKGKKVILWAHSYGETALGNGETESSWQRFEVKNKAGKNSKVVDYRFDQEDLSGNWSQLTVIVVDAKGTFANNADAYFYVQEDTPENRDQQYAGVVK